MSSDDVQLWLAARTTDVPASLAQRMKDAAGDVAASDDASMSTMLGEAALVCLREAMPQCDERTAALHLLAADALITYACEAAFEASAEPDADPLGSLWARHAPDRLASRLGPT